MPALHGSPVPDTNQLPPQLVQRILAAVLVLPLPLAARYPMLAWRAGGLACCSPRWSRWPGGAAGRGDRRRWPRCSRAFILAGIRQLGGGAWPWMWALSLIPWGLWLIADIPDLNGPAGATVVFTATAIAVDSIGSRLLAQRALAAQTERTEAAAGAAGRAAGARPDRAGTA